MNYDGYAGRGRYFVVEIEISSLGMISNWRWWWGLEMDIVYHPARHFTQTPFLFDSPKTWNLTGNHNNLLAL